MSQISVTNLTFAYEGSYDNIFENVSFQLDTDWKLGLTGRNGRGKTTFLRLLMEQNLPVEKRCMDYQGSIQASVQFDYFPYQVQDGWQLTTDVAEEICPGGQLWQLKRELSRLQVDEDVLYRPFLTLSFGEQTKVMLAALFMEQNHFLLIDEPTNHLDRLAREAVADYLNSKKGFILVSHDRRFLDGCTDHTMSINRMDIQVQQGSFSVWYENKCRQDAFEQAENDRLKKDIRKLEAAARQAGGWADKVEAQKIGRAPGETAIGLRPYLGEKSRKMQKRRKNLERRQERAIEEKSHLLKNVEQTEDLKVLPLSYHKEVLAAFEHVSVYYGQRKIVDDVSFTVRKGSRIALEGRNGSGKSTLLKLLLWEAAGKNREGQAGLPEGLRWEGRMEAGSQLIVSYVSQDTSGLQGTIRDYARANGIDETLMMTMLRKLDFSRTHLEKDLSQLSEGQKKKALIAASLCRQAHLYVWDEPLNFIDLFSRIQIEELLLAFQPAMVLVEHDSMFLDRIATEVVPLG